MHVQQFMVHTIFLFLFFKYCFSVLNPQVIYYNETSAIPPTATRFTTQIQPDGYLNETDWFNIPRIYRFYHNPTKIADFKFGYNDTFLFLGIEVLAPDLQANNCSTYDAACLYFEDVSTEIAFAVNWESDHNTQQFFKLMWNIYNQYEQVSGNSSEYTYVSDGADVSYPLFSGVVVNGTISPRGENGADTDSGFTMEVAIPKSSFMITPNSSFELSNIFFNFGINFDGEQATTFYWAFNKANDQWLFPPLILVEDCNVSSWSNWSDCNCSSELKERQRSILIPPSGPGEPCPSLSENSTCTCDCVMSPEEWSPCSSTCGQGTNTKTRRLLKFPSAHGECDVNSSRCLDPPCNYTEIHNCSVTNCSLPEPLIVTSLSKETFHGEIVISVTISTTTPVVTVFGNLSIGSSGNVDLQDSRVIIFGDFVNDGYITLSGNSTLNISGCAHLNGTLHIDLSKRKDQESIISYNCRVGFFKEVTFGNTGECMKASTQYKGKSMSLSLTRGCDDWLPVILGVSLGFVAILVVVVIVFVLRNEEVKEKVFPYRPKPDLLDS